MSATNPTSTPPRKASSCSRNAAIAARSTTIRAALCPFCLSPNVAWQDAKGTGTIYTYSVTRRAGPVPYCIAYVTLDEGVKMMTNIVDCDLDTVRIGQKVKVVFKKSEGGVSVPMFAPA